MRGTGFLLEAILLVMIVVAVGAQSVDAPMVRVRTSPRSSLRTRLSHDRSWSLIVTHGRCHTNFSAWTSSSYPQQSCPQPKGQSRQTYLGKSGSFHKVRLKYILHSLFVFDNIHPIPRTHLRSISTRIAPRRQLKRTSGTTSRLQSTTRDLSLSSKHFC